MMNYLDTCNGASVETSSMSARVLWKYLFAQRPVSTVGTAEGATSERRVRSRGRTGDPGSLGRRLNKAPARRPTLRPRPRVAVRQGRQRRELPRRALRVLGRRIGQHRRHRRVVLEIVEHDLVVRVPVGVPGILAVLRIARLQPERRRRTAEERRMVTA